MFLEGIDPAQGVDVLSRWVARARLGLHLRLAKISDLINQELLLENPAEAAHLISQYLEEAGLDAGQKVDYSAGQAGGVAQLGAYLKLAELNALRWLLPFQKWEGAPTAPRPAYDYPGREWAWHIHKLASRYGWTRPEIFDLWPEEAASYLQEIFVAEFAETDEARSLTEIGYRYDKVTKQSTFIPTPRPGWMLDEKPKMRRIRKDMLPMGHIIKLSELRPEDVTLH